jgi:hypothetical protein
MESFKIITKESFEKEIKQLFPVEDIIFSEIIFGGVIPIIFIRFISVVELNKNWKEFNSYIAAEYMTSIKDEYSKWNFYIFYLSKDLVEKPLKYEIENNKFSSRKIVIENCNALSEKEFNKIISEHITNDNVQINIADKKVTKFKKDKSLSSIIDKLNVKKKSEEDLLNILDLIENNYKDEI